MYQLPIMKLRAERIRIERLIVKYHRQVNELSTAINILENHANVGSFIQKPIDDEDVIELADLDFSDLELPTERRW